MKRLFLILCIFCCGACTGPDNRLAISPELGAYDYADALLSSGRENAALMQLQAMSPTTGVLVRQARAALQSGNVSLALASARAATDASPRNAVAWGMMGIVYDAMGEHIQAQAAYHAALEMHGPDRHKILNNLALSQAQSGQAYLSVKTMEKALRMRPGSPTVMANLALVKELATTEHFDQDARNSILD